MIPGFTRCRPVVVAAICVLAAFGWEWLLVEGRFGGDWSGLYYTGEWWLPSAVAAEHPFILKGSSGFDGQYYHAIAHDPFGSPESFAYVDAARLRYSRILTPLLSYMLALGHSEWVDRSFRAILLAAAFLGVWCLASFAVLHGRTPWIGALFLVVPATYMSLERTLIDLPTSALFALAFYGWARGRRSLIWFALAAALFNRADGWTAILAFALASGTRRSWRDTALWLSSALPKLAWDAFASPKLPGSLFDPLQAFGYPFQFLTWALSRPYPAFATWMRAGDYFAYAGLAAMIAAPWLLSYRLARNSRPASTAPDSRDRVFRPLRSLDPTVWTALLFSVLALAMSSTRYYDYAEVYDFARQQSPLLTALLFAFAATGTRALLVPLALVTPRSIALVAYWTIQSAAAILRARA